MSFEDDALYHHYTRKGHHSMGRMPVVNLQDEDPTLPPPIPSPMWRGNGSIGRMPVVRPFDWQPSYRSRRHGGPGRYGRRQRIEKVVIVAKPNKFEAKWPSKKDNKKDALKGHMAALVEELKKKVGDINGEFEKEILPRLSTARTRRSYRGADEADYQLPGPPLLILWKHLLRLIDSFGGEAEKLANDWLTAYEDEEKAKAPPPPPPPPPGKIYYYHLPEPAPIEQEDPDFSTHYVSLTARGDRYYFVGPALNMDNSSIGALSHSSKSKFGTPHEALAASINKSVADNNKTRELFEAIGEGDAFVRLYYHAEKKSVWPCKANELDKSKMKVDCNLDGYVKPEDQKAFKAWLSNPHDPIKFFVFGAKEKGQNGTYYGRTMHHDTRFRLPPSMYKQFKDKIQEHADGILRFDPGHAPTWVALGIGQTWAACFGKGVIKHNFNWLAKSETGPPKEHKAYEPLKKILDGEEPQLQVGVWNSATKTRSMTEFALVSNKFTSLAGIMVLTLDPLSSNRFYLVYKNGGVVMHEPKPPHQPNGPMCALKFFALLNFGWTMPGDIGLVKKAYNHHMPKQESLDPEKKKKDMKQSQEEMQEEIRLKEKGKKGKPAQAEPEEVKFEEFVALKTAVVS